MKNKVLVPVNSRSVPFHASAGEKGGFTVLMTFTAYSMHITKPGPEKYSNRDNKTSVVLQLVCTHHESISGSTKLVALPSRDFFNDFEN